MCGSHAGDGDSVSYFETIALDYLCCPAFRVPSCKIAAAQATIENKASTYYYFMRVYVCV